MSASSLNSSDLHSPDFFPFKGNSSVNEVSDCLIKKINETVRYNFILRGYLIDDLSSFNKEKLITWISSPARRFQNLAANPRDHFAIPETVDRLFESLKGSIQQGGASVSNQEKYYEDCASLVREKSASITPYAEDYDWMSLKISPSKDFKEAISMLFSQLEVQVLNDNTIEQKMKQIFRAMEEIGTIEMICNNLVSNFGLNREQAMQIAYRLQKGNPFHLSLVDMLLNNPSDLKDRNLCFLEQGTIHTFKVEEIHSEKPSHAISIFTLVGKKQKAIITVNDFSKLLTHIFWETEKAGNLRSFSVELTAHQQNEIYITQTEPFTNELFIEKLKQRSVAEKAIIDHLKTVDLKPILNCLIANWSHHEDLLLEGGEILALLRDVFRSRELEDRVLTICQIDEISLQSLEESNLLLDYVFRANLEQMAPNLNLSEGSDLIKMLGTSLETSKDLEGKRGVAILGETGSGKSTTTCFLVGAKMEEYLNRFGKTCVRVAESLEDNLLPEVGFSLGISKTTFAQGFHLASLEEDGQRIGRRVHSNSKVDFPQHIRQDQFSIVDFPGFYDTRGTEYEVVTSFSIDHGILSLQALDAAIQVLPYDLLTSRRSAFFINALRELSARFGGAFRDPTLSGRIFFLITKQDPGVGVSQLRERALELVHEDRNSASPDPEKCALLTFFANQCQNGRVFAISPTARAQRIDILNKVLQSSQKSNEEGGLKERYQLSLESPEMKMKFADVLNKSIGIWANTVLPEFLEHSKNRIQQVEARIGEIRKNQQQSLEDIDLKLQKIGELNRENNRTQLSIELLRKESLDHLPPDLLEEITVNEQGRFSRIEKDIRDLQDCEKRLVNEEAKIQKSLKSEERKEQAFSDEIRLKNQKITDLTTGTAPQELHTSTDYSRWNSVSVLNNANIDWTAKRRRAIDRGTDRLSDHASGTGIKTYNMNERFSVAKIANVHEDYQLLPPGEDQSNAIALNQLIQGQKSISLDRGNYRIEVVSNKIRFDYIRHHGDGKQICYGYIEEFDGHAPYPNLTITHIIPKAQLNNSEVGRIKQDINALTGLQGPCQKEIGRLKGEIKIIQGRLTAAQKEIKETQELLAVQKAQAQQDRVSDILKRLQEQVQENEREKARFELDIAKTEEIIQKLKTDAAECENSLKGLVFQRKRWALFTRTHASHLENAVKMAQFFVSLKPKPSGIIAIDAKESNIVKECQIFLDFYRNQKDHLEQELNALGLTAKERS